MAKILVVDDALFMRKMIADILSHAGHEIIGQAENAKEAVDLYKKLQPDLVTMDIVMPEVERVTTLKAIQAIKQFDSKAKIILVSSMDQQEIIVELIRAGAKALIVKPFKAEEVVKVVKTELGQ